LHGQHFLSVQLSLPGRDRAPDNPPKQEEPINLKNLFCFYFSDYFPVYCLRVNLFAFKNFGTAKLKKEFQPTGSIVLLPPIKRVPLSFRVDFDNDFVNSLHSKTPGKFPHHCPSKFE
jgi:hypothetical protein